MDCWGAVNCFSWGAVEDTIDGDGGHHGTSSDPLDSVGIQSVQCGF